MNKVFLTILLVILSGAAFAVVPSPSTPMIMLPDGTFLNGTNGAISVDIGSDSAVVEAITDSTQVSNESISQIVQLVPNVAQTIVSALPIGCPREFIHISTVVAGKTFWLDVNNVAVIGDCKLIQDWTTWPTRGAVSFSLIASEALKLWVVEGGKN